MDGIKNLFVLGGLLADLSVIVGILPLDLEFLVACLNLLFKPTLELLLFLVLDDIDCIVDHILPLLELTGVDDDQVLVQIELAHIFRNLAGHCQGQVQLLFHFLL